MSNTLTFGTTPPPPKHKCVVCKSTRWGNINGEWTCLDCREKKGKGK